MHATLSRVVRTMWSMWSIIKVWSASNDPRVPEARDVIVGEAELAQDFFCVLAELGRLRADRARGRRELRDDARHLERLAVGRGDRLDHAARGEVRIGSDVGRAVDPAGWDFCC